MLGGVDRSTKETFLVELPNGKRDRDTLHKYILKYVATGSYIITDSWAAYDGLEKYGYKVVLKA